MIFIQEDVFENVVLRPQYVNYDEYLLLFAHMCLTVHAEDQCIICNVGHCILYGYVL